MNPALDLDRLAFLRLVAWPAIESDREYGVPAAITIAQAIIESGWGRSSLFVFAKNPFGIKYSHGLDRDYGELDLPTREYIDGESIIVQGRFQRFPSLEEAFRAHARLLALHKRYAPAMDVRTSPGRFAQALEVCGYSTDPEYANKLMQLVRQFSLEDSAVIAEWAGRSARRPEALAGGSEVRSQEV